MNGAQPYIKEKAQVGVNGALQALTTGSTHGGQAGDEAKDTHQGPPGRKGL